jgi:hypothetical protein
MAERSINTGHWINFSGTSTSDKTSGCVDYPMKEAIEMCLNENNFNRDGDFILSQVRSPLTSILLNEKQDQTAGS